MERRPRIGLSAFERRYHVDRFLHSKRYTTTLISEIEECFSFYQENSSNEDHISSIHGVGITLTRVPKETEGYSYLYEVNGQVKTLGKDKIEKAEGVEIVNKINRISIKYREHIKKKYGRSLS